MPDSRQHRSPRDRELLDVVTRMHAWLDAMVASGIDEREAVGAMILALGERMMLRHGVTAACALFLQHGLAMKEHGPDLLAEMKARGVH